MQSGRYKTRVLKCPGAVLDVQFTWIFLQYLASVIVEIMIAMQKFLTLYNLHCIEIIKTINFYYWKLKYQNVRDVEELLQNFSS